MPRVLIIGYGNPLRCDDSLAWRAADDLSIQGLPEDVKIVRLHQLTPELAFSVSQAETVLFLDAAVDGTPGEIKCQPIKPICTPAVFAHDLTPQAILFLARELYGGDPRAFLVSLCGECFAHGEKLSESVERKLPDFLQLVMALTEPSMMPANRTEQVHA